MRSRLDVAANAAIVVLALAIGGVVLKRNLQSRSQPATVTGPTAGTTITLPGPHLWPSDKKTLVLALSPDCRYCTESAGFYRDLTAAAIKKSVQLVAVLPARQADSGRYLAQIEVAISDIREHDLKSIGIRATPTLMLISTDGRLSRSWLGRLTSQQEREVMAALN